MSLKELITKKRIEALKNKESNKSQTISMILASIKQIEVDKRMAEGLNDEGVLTVLNKMVKQRLDSISQYVSAGRQELADIEQKEIEIIKEFLPEQATEEQIVSVIEQAIKAVGSATIRDMGKIMGLVKQELNGKADMGKVSQIIKSKLVG